LPHGQHAASFGVKYGLKSVDSSTPNFTPLVHGWGVGHKSENFMEFGIINALYGRIHWAAFTQFSRFVSSSSLG